MPLKKQPNSGVVKPHKEVVALKLIIIFAVLLIPVAIILLAMSNQFLTIGKNKKSANLNSGLSANSNQSKAEQDFNFAAVVPNEKVGDLANVPQEKIDTLFDNLKK